MRRVIYLSSAREDFSTADIEQILEVSRRNNSRDGITGLLAYHDKSFFQVVEGPQEAISALMMRIQADTRHSSFMTLSDMQVETRAFPGWQMALVPKHDLARLAEGAGLSLSALSQQPMELSADRRVNILFKSFLRSFRDMAVR